jgi:hypothetical protein
MNPMSVKIDSFPLIAAPVDQAWAVFQQYEPNAFVYIQALTSGASCQVASGLNVTSALGAPTVLNFTQPGQISIVSIPIGGSLVNRVTQVLPITGRFSVTFVSPSPFNTYNAAPTYNTFGV